MPGRDAHVAARRGHARLARRRRRARAPAAARGRADVASASATSWRAHAVRSSIPAAARRRLHAEILEALARGRRRSGRPRPPRRAGRRRRRRRRATRSSPRAARPSSSRTARRTRSTRRAARVRSTGWRRREQADVLEQLAASAYAVGRLDDALAAIERAIELHATLGDERARSAAACARSRATAGSRAKAQRRAQAAHDAIAILEPLGAVGRARARLQRRCRSSRCWPRTSSAALEWGERALALATELGDDRTRAHVLVNLGSARLNQDGETAPLLEAHARRRRGGRPARGGARARQPRPQPHVLGAAGRGAALRASRRPRTAPGTSST